MKCRGFCLIAAAPVLLLPWYSVHAQELLPPESPLPSIEKVKNYLPHMTRPEVQEFLTRSDMVIIPVAALEQHGHHLPIGTDYLNGLELAKLISQKADVLVAPILSQDSLPITWVLRER